MSISKHVFLSFVFTLAFSAAARADELDFYKFRTKHSPGANKVVRFDAQVLETNIMDSSVDDTTSFRCLASFDSPADQARCRVRGTTYLLDASEGSARFLLTHGKGLRKSEILELKLKSPGIFQALATRDRVYHVKIAIPNVADDSMACEIGVIREKKTGWIRCGSEFAREHWFTVRDLPLLDSDRRELVFGAASLEGDKAAIAKARDVVVKMLALKRTSPKTVKTDEIYNFVVNLGAWYEVVGVNYASKQEGYGWDRHVVWGAQEALGFERQGDFDYVHRGVVELGEGRRGD